MFSVPDIENRTYGEPPVETFNDLEDTDKIRQIITTNPARTVDHLVLSQKPESVKTALIIGPLIYGTGRGPGTKPKGRSHLSCLRHLLTFCPSACRLYEKHPGP